MTIGNGLSNRISATGRVGRAAGTRRAGTVGCLRKFITGAVGRGQWSHAKPKPTEQDKAEFRSVIPADPAVVVKPMFGTRVRSLNGSMFAGLFGSTIGVRLVEDPADGSWRRSTAAGHSGRNPIVGRGKWPALIELFGAASPVDLYRNPATWSDAYGCPPQPARAIEKRAI